MTVWIATLVTGVAMPVILFGIILYVKSILTSVLTCWSSTPQTNAVCGVFH